MKVKIFHALTMQDAMRTIKEELGPDAIILSSKEVREGGR
ncbi:MAG: protein FlhF, partial [Nitrospira sp.]|nr:protein FlhF [Nitrospira sp.]